jgi:hypothetical protein
MNIFVLDRNTKLCAQYHNNRHVVKMILETTQLLNNVFIKHDPNYVPVYKPTHKNHPASIWASENLSNFKWLLQLGLDLCEEYTFRYDKVHKCESILREFAKSKSRDKIPHGELKQFALCMPEQYHSSDPVAAYRNYYKGDKQHIADWKRRTPPAWY